MVKANVRVNSIAQGAVRIGCLSTHELVRRFKMVFDNPGMLDRVQDLDTEHYRAWGYFTRCMECHHSQTPETLFECFQSNYVGTYVSWKGFLSSALWMGTENDQGVAEVHTPYWPDLPDVAAERVAEYYLACCFKVAYDDGFYVVFRNDA